MTRDDDGPVLDAVSCAYCGAVFDGRGHPATDGEHACPVCRGESLAYRPRFQEMDVYDPNVTY